MDWSRRATWHGLISILLILGAGWIVLSRVLPDGSGSALGFLAIPRRGSRAPDFTLTDLEGQPVSLSDMQGQVVLLNFWATWCPPCRQEMPALQEVYEQTHSQGFQVLAVNLQEQGAAVSAFVAEIGLTFPVLVDRDGGVSSAYHVTSLPTTFIIDRSGVIHDVVVGGPLTQALILSKVTPLLAQGGGD